MKYNEITINTDGGARGNPGPAAIGITVQAGNEHFSKFRNISANRLITSPNIRPLSTPFIT